MVFLLSDFTPLQTLTSTSVIRAQLLTHLSDKVALKTHFSGVHPALGAGHLLPLVAAARGLSRTVRVLEQLAATGAAVLVQGDAGPDQLFPCEVAHGEEPRVWPAVECLWDHREEHRAGEVERDREVREPTPQNDLFGVAAKAADAREKFDLVIHPGQRQRFEGKAGSAGLRGESDSLFGPGTLHLQRQSIERRELHICNVPSPRESCKGEGVTSSLTPTTIKPDLNCGTNLDV